MLKHNITFTLYTLKETQPYKFKPIKIVLSLFNHMSNISTILNLQNKQVILVLNNIFKHTLNK